MNQINTLAVLALLYMMGEYGYGAALGDGPYIQGALGACIPAIGVVFGYALGRVWVIK